MIPGRGTGRFRAAGVIPTTSTCCILLSASLRKSAESGLTGSIREPRCHLCWRGGERVRSC